MFSEIMAISRLSQSGVKPPHSKILPLMILEFFFRQPAKKLFPLLALCLFLPQVASSYGQQGGASAAVTFTDVTKQAGITWVHDNAISPERFLPETVGAGCVFFDYDNDGWMDIYLVNSGPSDFFAPAKPIKNALYRNNHDGTFTDVTDKAGVAGGTFGMGVAAED